MRIRSPLRKQRHKSKIGWRGGLENCLQQTRKLVGYALRWPVAEIADRFFEQVASSATARLAVKNCASHTTENAPTYP